MLKLHGISEMQQPVEGVPTIHIKRLGVILKQGDMFLLEVNTTPGYNRISTFLNTTLSKDINQIFSDIELQEKGIELISKRTGYYNVQYIKTLQGDIERSFHKPDKDYNEIGLYSNSILVYDLISDEQSLAGPNHPRELQWNTRTELQSLLQKNGANGSSWLMKDLYEHKNSNA